MKLFGNLFRKKEHPYFEILRYVLPENFEFNNYKIYYIKGFEMTDKNIELFVLNSDKEDFVSILKELKYNSQADNVSVYYLEKELDRGEIILITDPLELYEKEQIIKRYSCFLNQKVLSLETVERIN
ncbi:hypothetical protein [Flavobacterium psychrophilum]|uniref:Uncharacterized protein n=1 Tax=Flavobacterium psychrophilum TaxID=96345 RepID=A0A7U2NFK9_FLAPS|nr:hypothetical protein [Flavobacterium psychrophilum]OAE90432.1 hypothetical protein SU65_11875 [Flavobacterium psychrophilum]QRE04058.1 hypothetical protein H0H26_00135 [Flavobacterium psychrophilum]